MIVEDELPLHRRAVLELTREAFGGCEEADIIVRLGRDGLVLASLVALSDGEVAGHIMFSRLAVAVEGQDLRAATLAPMAVKSGQRRRGIGAALVGEGLGRMRDEGIEAVIVLGHESYYPRFGFRHDLVRNIASPFTDHQGFMGLELRPGCLGGRSGICTYPAAFGIG